MEHEEATVEGGLGLEWRLWGTWGQPMTQVPQRHRTQLFF